MSIIRLTNKKLSRILLQLMNYDRYIFIYPFYRVLIIYFKCLFLIFIFLCIYLFLKFHSSIPEQTHVNAYIISSNCRSDRFWQTKANLERVFPNFFTIYCFKITYTEKVITDLIDEILNLSDQDEYQWSFIFQDDIDFIDPIKFALDNYLNTIQELIHDFDIRIHDGLIYLGIYQPEFMVNHYGLVSSYSNSSLFSSKGFGLGTYAIGLTKKFARTFASEMLSYVTNNNQPIDMYIKNYCLHSGKRYFVLGSNVHPTRNADYFGIAYPDENRFSIGTW